MPSILDNLAQHGNPEFVQVQRWNSTWETSERHNMKGTFSIAGGSMLFIIGVGTIPCPLITHVDSIRWSPFSTMEVRLFRNSSLLTHETQNPCSRQPTTLCEKRPGIVVDNRSSNVRGNPAGKETCNTDSVACERFAQRVERRHRMNVTSSRTLSFHLIWTPYYVL